MHRDEVATAHGTCVLVTLDDHELVDALAALPAEEQARAHTLSPIRRREWITGRTALHAAGVAGAILSTARGAPILPSGLVGSVSHKGATAAAIVTPASAGYIGIDLERAAAPRLDIAIQILTAREQAALPDRGRAVTLRFAIKEAIYKAVDPIVNRYVGFTEVELEVRTDGSCHVHVLDASRLPVVVDAWWYEHDGLWLATARGRSR